MVQLRADISIYVTVSPPKGNGSGICGARYVNGAELTCWVSCHPINKEGVEMRLKTVGYTELGRRGSQ